MAKRSPVDEKPFRPLDVSVLSAVVNHRSGSAERVGELNVGVSPAGAIESLVKPAEVTSGPRLDQEKRVLFTREETQALDRLVIQLAHRLRTQVKASHVLRAVSSLLLSAEAQIDQRAGERGALVRPPNGDFDALQRFEREIAHILAHGLRDAGLPR